ncbi:MAG: hypothetical protein COX81_00540 [Candidatus Magasanikbacteria bacterium CG_4_10_14_0_2_um_filter_37_12]|uniref:Uncharacterized protein n=1 Tax=Candidatus Magasanikbacteria bacterium CG_4_10_14_0_2_um_filter_37_12 TaxID=1974637 RepID=A0A2M7VA16_9BACT|nr:MAG: hypothetical protein COX81_00540 [Candidatus Magasanikbacteria bacterium CG_4_10_14_0_2_um_filter_37_12]
MKIIFGLVGIAVGTLLIIKTEWFIQNFGTSSWAENKIGFSGGTRLLYKLIGLVVIIIAILGMTGMLGGILISVFGRLFGM